MLHAISLLHAGTAGMALNVQRGVCMTQARPAIGAMQQHVPLFARRSLMAAAAPPESTDEEKSARPTGYDHAALEFKWQQFWREQRTFATRRREGKEKKYVLDMFPYPSGAGLHVGHPEGYTASDIMARYWRMRDYDVLHPMGWDSFGLPAEQHAINTGTHPEATTKENIANFKRQLQSLGFSYDWERELATTDEAYVRWTQWIFVQLFKKGGARARARRTSDSELSTPLIRTPLTHCSLARCSPAHAGRHRSPTTTYLLPLPVGRPGFPEGSLSQLVRGARHRACERGAPPRHNHP